jgi:hypothetical protein
MMSNLHHKITLELQWLLIADLLAARHAYGQGRG